MNRLGYRIAWGLLALALLGYAGWAGYWFFSDNHFFDR